MKYILEYKEFNDLTIEEQEIKEKAISNGTFLKATNGKKTKLTEKQWLQVRTKNFINWFGDWINDSENSSKVIDENGEPMVVYHGAYDFGFTEFNKKLKGLSTNAKSAKLGFFFYDDKSNAISFSKRSAGGGIYEVFLCMISPNIKDFKNQDKINTDVELYNLIKKGVDGAIALNIKDGYEIGNQYIVLEPIQIKSATNNNGDFDTNNKNINK